MNADTPAALLSSNKISGCLQYRSIAARGRARWWRADRGVSACRMAIRAMRETSAGFNDHVF